MRLDMKRSTAATLKLLFSNSSTSRYVLFIFYHKKMILKTVFVVTFKVVKYPWDKLAPAITLWQI